MSGDIISTITRSRLANQLLARPVQSVSEAVAALGAMQAQDYGGARWAVGLRVARATEAGVEQALIDGAIVRTHPMRGTHHFVAAADVRWLLELIAPRSLARVAPRHRQLGLDASTLRTALRALERALGNGRHLERAEIARVLADAGVSPDGQRLPHIVAYAEVVGLVCSGVRRGKQITIALLDERVPSSRPRGRADALAELARRYFTTRGPATVADFVWWSSLTAADARAAIAGADLVAETIDGVAHWRGAKRTGAAARAYLLPPFDEYTVAYKDRSHAGRAPRTARTASETWLLAPNLVIDGLVSGTWKRVLGARARIEITPWRRLARDEVAAVEAAAARYAAFVELPADVRIVNGGRATSTTRAVRATSRRRR